MKNTLIKSLAIAMVLTILAGMIPAQNVSAANSIYSTEAMPVTYVASLENTQYPTTSEDYFVGSSTTTHKITLNSPSLLKLYFSWGSNLSTVTCWISMDHDGINVIGTKTTNKTSGSSAVYALDPGTYYVNYSATFASKDTTFSTVNVAALAETVTDTTNGSTTSKTNPLALAEGQYIPGFLSITAPIDYYILSVSEKTTYWFDFNFRQFNEINVASGVLNIYNYYTDALVSTAKFNKSAGASNTLAVTLEPGTYYITLSGALTTTSLKVSHNPIESAPVDTTEQTASPVKEKAEKMSVVYVDYVDNVQYPETSKFTTVSGNIGVKYFKLTKPTIMKIYMTWDTDVFNKATVWISRDAGGYDLVEEKTTLSKTTSYLFRLLDPGTYYVNYSMSGTTSKNAPNPSAVTGICLLGQKVSTSEKKNYASSYENPVALTLGKTAKGFLSITAPVDYYKFVIDEQSEVTIAYDFAQYDSVKVSSGKIKLFDSKNVLITSKTYSASGKNANTFSTLLDKGTYYISMSGAETTTQLTVTAVSRTITVTQTQSGSSVKLALTFAFEPTEIKMYKGYIYNVDITNSTYWNNGVKGLTKLSGKSATVSSNGYYTFRIKDGSGNYFLKRVKVQDCK